MKAAAPWQLTNMASSSSNCVVDLSSGWKRMVRNLAPAVRSHCHCAGVSGALQLRFTGVPAQGNPDLANGSGALRVANERRQKRKVAA